MWEWNKYLYINKADRVSPWVICQCNRHMSLRQLLHMRMKQWKSYWICQWTEVCRSTKVTRGQHFSCAPMLLVSLAAAAGTAQSPEACSHWLACSRWHPRPAWRMWEGGDRLLVKSTKTKTRKVKQSNIKQIKVT